MTISSRYRNPRYRKKAAMALTDTFVKQVKHTGKATGDKHSDGKSMYLLVKAAGKYWRLDYAHASKRKTLALGVYPDVSLAEARQGRDMMAERLTGIPQDMVEAQLGHGKKGPLGSAYDRAEYLAQRHEMMQTWADYLDKLRTGAEVIQFKAA